jgi:hypothetical protein
MQRHKYLIGFEVKVRPNVMGVCVVWQELLLRIFSWLDIVSLCRCAQVRYRTLLVLLKLRLNHKNITTAVQLPYLAATGCALRRACHPPLASSPGTKYKYFWRIFL